MKRSPLMKWLLAALLLLPGLLLLWLWHTDLGRFKPQLVALLGKQLGTEVVVEGPLAIQLGRTVSIQAAGLRVANPGWAQRPWLLSADSLGLEIELASLLRGPVVFENLDISGLEVAAEVSASGLGSWQLAAPAQASEAGQAGRGMLLRHIRVLDSQVNYYPANGSRPLQLQLDEFQQRTGADDLLQLTLRGQLNQQALQYSGTLGPFANLRSGTDVQFDGKGQLGDLQLQGQGMIDQFARPRWPRFEGSLSGANLQALERFLPGSGLPARPYQASISLQPSDTRLAVAIEASSGPLALSLHGSSSELLALDSLRYELSASGDQLGVYTRLLGLAGLPDDPFNISGEFNREGPQLGFEAVQAQIGQAQLALDGELHNFPSLDEGELQLKLSGPEIGDFRQLLGIDGRSKGPFSASFRLVPGGDNRDYFDVSLDVEPFSANASGRFGPGPEFIGTQAQLELSAAEVAHVAALFGLEMEAIGDLQLATGLDYSAAGFELTALKGRIGENLVTAEGLVTANAGLAGSDLALSASGPSLAAVLQPYTSQPVAAAAYSVQGRLRPAPGQLQIDDLQASFAGLQGSGNISLQAPFNGSNLGFAVRLEADDVRQLWPDQARGRVQQNPLSATLEGSARAGAWAISDGHIQVGPALLQLDGTLGRLPDLSATRFTLQLDAPRLDSLLVLPEGPLTATPLRLAGQLSGSTSSFALKDFSLQAGSSDLRGQASVSLAEAKPRLNLSLQSRLLDLSMQHSVEQAEPAAPAKGDRLIPDISLPMQLLQPLNARFELKADQLRTPLDIYSAVRLQGTVENGGLRVSELRGEGIKGFASGAFTLLPGSSGVPELGATLRLQGLVLNLSRSRHPGAVDLPTLDLELEANGKGADLRSIAASLNGHLYTRGGAGVIPDSVLSAIDTGFLQQIFSALVPVTARSKSSQLACFFSRLEAVDGLVEAAPAAAIVTDKVQVISHGSINLANERLDLGIQTTPTKAYQANASEILLNPFIKIGGTLGQPRLELDTERALIFSGAAAATGGLSILAKGLYDRLRASGDPCTELEKLATAGQ
jgi:hypothetical protein